MIFDQVSAVTSPIVTAVVLKKARRLLLDIYGGAKAAYSLRELSTSWKDQDVVEVRRASDDTTSGFTATELTDGTLTNWVNATVALPLDATGTGLPLDTEFVAFDGVDDYVDLGGSKTVGSGDFTWTFSAVFDSFSNNTWLFIDGGGGGTRPFSVGASNNFEILRASEGGAIFTNIAVSQDLSTGIVYNFTVQRTGSTYDLTIVGGGNTLTDQVTGGPTGDLTAHFFGAYAGSSGFFHGKLFDIDFGVSAYDGYGATPWNDTVGTNHGTVNGSPSTTTIGAAAAYSLRDLTTSRTNITSNGDTGGDTSDAWVVQARRSSDDNLKSFTAAQVAGSTMVDWVNAVTVTQDHELNVSFQGGPLGTATASGGGRTKTYVFTGATTGESILYRTDYFAPTLVTDATSTLSFTITGLTGGSVEIYRTSLSGTRLAEITSDGSYTVPFTGSGSQENMYLTVVGTSVDFTLSAWYATHTLPNDGYVSTWYDQAGTNHGTQTTVFKQPRIVADGAQVFENSVPAIRPDGVDDTIDIPTISGNNFSVFAKYHAPTDSSLIFRNTGGNATAAGRRSNTHWYFQYDGTTYDQAIDHPSTPVVANYQVIDTDMMIRGNGVDVWTPQTVTAGTNSNISRIANYLGGTGTVSEVIIYTTDQTDNRKALESNMADFYGIDLDAAADHDSGEDQVDGFVTTWYDQSGQGNDATQAVSTSQPKIVEAGVLITEGGVPAIKPDGSDDRFDLTSNITGGNYSIFATYQSSSNPSYLVAGSGGYMDMGRRAGSGVWVYSYSGGGLITSTTHPTTRVLGHFQGIGEDVSIYGNGALIDSASGVGVNSANISKLIGLYGGTYYWNGCIQEIIIYDSDQSANRTGIEGNINTEYNIYP